MADTKANTVSARRDMPPLQMRAEFQPGSLDVDKRTVLLTWTTGAPVLRTPWFDDPFYEELSLDPSHVRMGRLQSGTAQLLNAHRSYDIDDIIGVVESADLDVSGRSGSAIVRFARTPEGDKAMGMVADRVLRNVSVGYRTYKMQKVEGGETTIDTYRAVDWEPYELSMVPIGADAGAATRSAGGANPCEFIKERAMPDPVQPTTTATVNPAPAPAPAPVAAAVTDEQRIAAATAERERVLGIQRAARTLGRPQAEIDDAIARGLPLDKYRELAIDARAKSEEDGGQHTQAGGGQGGIRVQQGATGHEKWERAITAAMIARCGSDATQAIKRYEEKTGEKLADLDPGEFRGMRILDVARACLDRSRVSYRGMTALETIGLALTAERSADDSFFTTRSPSMTTGDFPLILENVLHKLLLAQYGITPDTWRTMCTVGSAVDFRPNPRYRLGSFSALDSLDEDGEFKNKALGDAEKQTITVATKGNILAISRQALLNDDMSAFSRVAMMFGRAAAFSIETDFYALLAQNSGLGPTMLDTHPLFDAAHNNINATGSALSAGGIDADRVVMKSQKDPSGNEILDIRPAVLLVPASLGGTARQINQGQYDFDSLTVAGAARSTYAMPNRVGGLFRDIVDTARLSGTRRYLFADPAIYPVIEVVFLDGQQQPYMEMRQGWRIDGIEWKIRLDYAVGAIDFRGAVTNAGV